MGSPHCRVEGAWLQGTILLTCRSLAQMHLIPEIGLIFCSANSYISIPSWTNGSNLRELNFRHFAKVAFGTTLTQIHDCFMFVSYLTTPFQYRGMNWKGLGRKMSRPRDTIPEFSWRDWGKPRKSQSDKEMSGWNSNQAPPEYKSEAFTLNQPVQCDRVIMVFMCIGDVLVMTINILVCLIPYLDLQRPAITRHVSESGARAVFEHVIVFRIVTHISTLCIFDCKPHFQSLC
jgi:hypothetical protein